MLGLLAAAHVGCRPTSSGEPDPSDNAETSSDADTETGSTDNSTGADSDAATTDADDSASETGSGDGGSDATTGSGAGGASGGSSSVADDMGGGGSSAADPDEPVVGVLSSKVIPDLSLEDFTEMCDEAGGIVETHASCHGAVTGPGFSYDDGTDVFTEHTCRGYNTCSGFSCVVPE